LPINGVKSVGEVDLQQGELGVGRVREGVPQGVSHDFHSAWTANSKVAIVEAWRSHPSHRGRNTWQRGGEEDLRNTGPNSTPRFGKSNGSGPLQGKVEGSEVRLQKLAG